MNNDAESAGAAPTTANTNDQSDKTRKKIVLYGVLVAIGTVGVFPLIIWGLWVGHAGSAAKADGTPAVARVDRQGEGFCWVGFEDSTCLLLHLTVYPEGEESFRTELEVNVEDRWLSKVQPGSYVRVVRDRDEPSKVYLNTEALPNAAPTPPSTETPTPSR